MIVIRFGKWNSKATSMFTYDRVYRNGCEWTPLCIKKFRYVDSQPTIDIDTIIKAHEDIGYEQGYRDGYAEVEPIKHGHWEYVDIPVFGNPYGSYKCDYCGNSMPHKTNYCPFCGAKMDGGDL